MCSKTGKYIFFSLLSQQLFLSFVFLTKILRFKFRQLRIQILAKIHSQCSFVQTFIHWRVNAEHWRESATTRSIVGFGVSLLEIQNIWTIWTSLQCFNLKSTALLLHHRRPGPQSKLERSMQWLSRSSLINSCSVKHTVYSFFFFFNHTEM